MTFLNANLEKETTDGQQHQQEADAMRQQQPQETHHRQQQQQQQQLGEQQQLLVAQEPRQLGEIHPSNSETAKSATKRSAPSLPHGATPSDRALRDYRPIKVKRSRISPADQYPGIEVLPNLKAETVNHLVAKHDEDPTDSPSLSESMSPPKSPTKSLEDPSEEARVHTGARDQDAKVDLEQSHGRQRQVASNEPTESDPTGLEVLIAAAEFVGGAPLSDQIRMPAQLLVRQPTGTVSDTNSLEDPHDDLCENEQTTLAIPNENHFNQHPTGGMKPKRRRKLDDDKLRAHSTIRDV